jgi:hypothetical protein
VKTGGDFFETLSDPEKLAQNAGAMTGLSRATGDAIAAKFPWRDYGKRDRHRVRPRRRPGRDCGCP